MCRTYANNVPFTVLRSLLEIQGAERHKAQNLRKHDLAPMARYYFHVQTNGVLLRDPDGIDVAGLDAARDQCRAFIQSVLEEEELTEAFSAGRKFQIVDERGRSVLIVPSSPASVFAK